MERKELLEILFSAKKELEKSKTREDFYALGYIDEAIKWVRHETI